MNVTDVWITMADGVRLAATLYLPDGDGPSPALLEALPYRKDDLTASYRRLVRPVAPTRAVSRCCRLDLRGTGSSGGMATDEYPDAERADLRAVIAWLATQPWSSGRVGMFGTSYSGFNSLQMAAERRAGARRRSSPSTPPTTGTPTTSTTTAARCGRSTSSTTCSTWCR